MPVDKWAEFRGKGRTRAAANPALQTDERVIVGALQALLFDPPAAERKR